MNSENHDFSLLRPFDLRLASQGDELCDARGREVAIDDAAEMVRQLGTGSLRMAPDTWLEGRPVYWDSVLQFAAGAYTLLEGELGDLGRPIGWPPEEVRVELFVNGELVDTQSLPRGKVVVSWGLHFSDAEKTRHG